MQIYAAGTWLPNYHGQNAGGGPGCLPLCLEFGHQDPSKLTIHLATSEWEKGCQEKNREASGALGLGEELQSLVLTTQAGGSNLREEEEPQARAPLSGLPRVWLGVT